MGIQEGGDLPHGDVCGLVKRISVDAATYGGKDYGAQMMLEGKFKGGAVAAGKQFRLMIIAAAPDRPDGMDDMAGGQVIASGDFRLAGMTALELPALCKESRSGGTVNGPVNTAAPEQRAVRGIDNGIHPEGCDIRLDHFNHTLFLGKQGVEEQSEADQAVSRSCASL